MSDTTDGTQSILVEPENTLDPWTIEDLPEALRNAAERMGWKSLMPVQAAASPYLSAGRDMIVQSRTGSGKTGAFLMPLIARIDPNANYPQGLVLVPTRELAMQVYDAFEQLSADMSLKGVLVYGGVGYGKQLDAMKGGAQVVIGTPGRVLDHIGRGSLNLDQLSVLVFDEADEMLSMGFYPDMKELRRYLPQKRLTWMFSATMPYKVQTLAEEFMRKPGFLSLSAGHETIDTMEHRWYQAPTMEKDRILIRVIEMERPDSAIVFCNMKTDVEYVANVLKGRGYNAEMISGDLSQKDRERVMRAIREGDVQFLVATDVAARGIDISDLSHVVLYDLPKDPELYVHRAGRTARAGNTGVAISFVGDMGEKTSLNKIARKYEIEFVEMPTPTEEQVVERTGERLSIYLEDRWRKQTAVQQEYCAGLEPLAQRLSGHQDEHLLLAMLLADVYRQRFNAVDGSANEEGNANDSSSVESTTEGTADAPSMPTEEQLTAYLDERWKGLRPAERKRITRLGPIVQSLSESEEERLLLTMLIIDSYQEHLKAEERRLRAKELEAAAKAKAAEGGTPKKKKRRRRKKSQGGGMRDER